MHFAQTYLQLRHGPDVQVDYVDVSNAEARAQFADLVAQAEKHSLPYPLVAIDGQLRLAGPASGYQVVRLIEEMLAKRSTPPQK